MSGKAKVLGAAVLLFNILAAGLTWGADPQATKSAGVKYATKIVERQEALTGHALHVLIKGKPEVPGYFLEAPTVKLLGNRWFLVGTQVPMFGKNPPPHERPRVWLPISQVELLEEFPDAADMARQFKALLPPPPMTK